MNNGEVEEEASNKGCCCLILPDHQPSSASEQSGDGDKMKQHKSSYINLAHPKTRTTSMFVSSQHLASTEGGEGTESEAVTTCISEVKCARPPFATWFIDDHVQSDGSLYVCTPVDPTFLVLPYLYESAESNKFVPLEHILIDRDHPHLASHVLSMKGIDDCVNNVADAKVCGDMKVFRYSSIKTMRYLGSKVLRVSSKVESLKSAHQEPSVITSESDNKHEMSDANLLEAHALVSEYLSDDVSNQLFDYLGLMDEDLNANTCDEPVAKKGRLDSTDAAVSEPAEDYSKRVGDLQGKAGKGATAPVTSKQKTLQKVAERQGIRSISSFFSKKK